MEKIIKELEKYCKESREPEQIKELLGLCLELIRSREACNSLPFPNETISTDYLYAELDLIKFITDF